MVRDVTKEKTIFHKMVVLFAIYFSFYVLEHWHNKNKYLSRKMYSNVKAMEIKISSQSPY